MVRRIRKLVSRFAVVHTFDRSPGKGSGWPGATLWLLFRIIIVGDYMAHGEAAQPGCCFYYSAIRLSIRFLSNKSSKTASAVSIVYPMPVARLKDSIEAVNSEIALL